VNKLISYAVDFVSFLLERIDKNKIDRIILFGSVARDEADSDSDVDLFIESVEDIKKPIKKIKDEFFNSTKFRDYWELKGIKSEIKIISGKLDNWKDIKNSVVSNGILL